MSLLEVVVTLAVLGVLTTVVGLSWQRQAATPETASAASAVAAARRQAIDSGTTVSVQVAVSGAVHVITVTPDGRIRGGDALAFDPLGGRLVQHESDTSRPASVQPDSKD